MAGEERHDYFWREKLFLDSAIGGFKNHNAKRLIWL